MEPEANRNPELEDLERGNEGEAERVTEREKRNEREKKQERE